MTESDTSPSEITVLILSADSVAAALLGALVETLGYPVKFARPPEPPQEALRRARPAICLVDSTDPVACNEELFGRAAMRGICVVIFGTPAVLDRMRALIHRYDLDTLLMPADLAEVERVLRRADAKRTSSQDA